MRHKIDRRIQLMIENCVATNHRGVFVILGEKGKDQLPVLHHILNKVKPQVDLNVLWAYKKNLAFERKKGKTKAAKRRAKRDRKLNSGSADVNEDDPFQNFIRQNKLRYCYYKETHNILGQTYGMCILQDFEAVTPNILARTIETVVGGGLVIILLRSLTSIEQLHTLTMDSHDQYRTENQQDVVGRFNKRLTLSLSKCSNCLVIDDRLQVIPILESCLSIAPVPPKSEADRLTEEELQLKKLKRDLMDNRETQLAGCLVKCCVTLDQAKGVLKFIEAIVDNSLSSTVVMKAARGRGKSAALGLAMAAAVAFGYSNIFVTSPSPENLITLFEFICKGLAELKYEEHTDYEKVISTKAESNKAVIAINIFKGHRQTIKYIEPQSSAQLAQAELVCIDEAAAIPMPLLEKLLGPYLVFMSSTVDGYEGTGQLLSQKLIKDLRQNSTIGKELDLSSLSDSLRPKPQSGIPYLAGRTLYEVTLKDSIRYANEDPVEKWLCSLLCLNISNLHAISSCPAPDRCQLFYVDTDELFSFQSISEEFLQQLITICVASEYKYSPDDLQMLSDAPGHHLFCLLGPKVKGNRAPEILCAMQVSLEGKISREAIANSLRNGIRSGGDLIPWTIEDQFGERDFASKSGARIVRIAVHPGLQDTQYGIRSLQLLQEYYEGKMLSLDEDEGDFGKRRLGDNLPSFLLRLTQRQPELLDYIGVNYGLSAELLRFWKSFNMTPVYIDPLTNEITGTHSCIMLKILNEEDDEEDLYEDEEMRNEKNKVDSWLTGLWLDFRRRFIELLPSNYRSWSASLANEVLHQPHVKSCKTELLTKEQLMWEFTLYDLSRLEKYASDRTDYLNVKDLVSRLGRMYFFGLIDSSFQMTQLAVLAGIGLQGKSPAELAKENDLIKGNVVSVTNKDKSVESQILSYFNQSLRILLKCLRSIQHEGEEKLIPIETTVQPAIGEEQEILDDVAEKFRIKTNDEDWKKSLAVVASKLNLKRKSEVNYERQDKKKKRKMNKRH